MYLEHLAKIQSTRSRVNKIQYLNDAKYDFIFTQILLYTYHPLWHYHLANIKTKGIGFETLKQAPWIFLLDQLRDRTLSGFSARQEVDLFISGLTYEDGELFKKILKKNLRIGISTTTINASQIETKIPVFEVMRAKEYTGTLKHPMYMSIKHDGLRAVLMNGKLYTRNGHVITGVDHILDQALVFGQKSLDGELMIPGMHFQESSGLIRSFNATPTAIYRVFDTPANIDPFIARYAALKEEYSTIEEVIPSIKLVKHVLTSSDIKVQETFNKVLDAGYEGLMLKDPTHMYVMKRSSSWLKMKAVNSIDVPITGYFEGQGKYEDNLGGLTVCTKDNIIVKVGGGFSDELRTAIWTNPNNYIGLTAEVRYHEKTPGGSLRHPRFVKFRSDK